MGLGLQTESAIGSRKIFSNTNELVHFIFSYTKFCSLEGVSKILIDMVCSI